MFNIVSGSGADWILSDLQLSKGSGKNPDSQGQDCISVDSPDLPSTMRPQFQDHLAFALQTKHFDLQACLELDPNNDVWKGANNRVDFLDYRNTHWETELSLHIFHVITSSGSKKMPVKKVQKSLLACIFFHKDQTTSSVFKVFQGTVQINSAKPTVNK